MLTSIAIAIFLIAFVVLAILGIQKGLDGHLIVFRGWGDFSFGITTTVMALYSLAQYCSDAPSFLLSLNIAVTLLSISILVAWINCARIAELLFALPARQFLPFVVFLGVVVTISGTKGALNKKASASTRGAHATVAAGAGLGTLKAVGLVKKLVAQAKLQLKARRSSGLKA